ncbi:glycosyltransferase family 2 protein [Leucobacter tenebrionis]|uniref:glycosyltransferase family 2 protein n=1 Tax=Leucobacter tenebrionis TaxID=2873270 RepID=UPI001CA680E9|nr:glycosyltransferase family 2 protein [Leucobacter tenebrionis]QZY53058.1 glycosyltransferase family 2 protein [Leucobacter tenebrionis]
MKRPSRRVGVPARGAESPGVSVVIPTVGRADLARAIASVRGQDYSGDIEILVIADLADGALDQGLAAGADAVLYTGGGRRAGAARNLGIQHASHPYVAFLDDDDEWSPRKLTVQMPVLVSGEADVVGSQAVYRNPGTHTTSPPIPTTVKREDQPFAEYLFRRRRASVGRPTIFSITLVARTELARRVPWDETLPRHQDWDWLDRLERAGASIMQIPEPLATVWTGSDGSISSSADWRSSLAWAQTRRGVWDPSVLSDFLAGQVLRYAFQSRSPAGVARTARAIAATRRLPAASTLILGLGGLVPRPLINRLMSRGRGSSQASERSSEVSQQA